MWQLSPEVLKHAARKICFNLTTTSLSDFTVLCVCVVLYNCTMYEYMDKMTSMKYCPELCLWMCVVRASQSKHWSQAKWCMKKLYLHKWPLGAVLSVLEGLQGHYTHHTHTDISKWACVSWRDCGVVSLLMGPYGHKTNTNCSSPLLVIRSWRCWSHSNGKTSRRELVRGCGLDSKGQRSLTCSISWPQQPTYGYITVVLISTR